MFFSALFNLQGANLRALHRRAFILPHRTQVVKHFFLAFFSLRRPPGPFSAARQELLSFSLSSHANFYILPRHSRFVKTFFSAFFRLPSLPASLILPSRERSITIPDSTPSCQLLFSLFLVLFSSFLKTTRWCIFSPRKTTIFSCK